MADSTPYFVALVPDQTLSASVLRAKSKVLAVVGPQLYLDDPPHITAYLGVFRSEDAARDAFLRITDALPPFDVHTTGWHVYMADVLTGHNTLVAAIAHDAASRLRQAQECIVRAMAPYRDSSACERRYRNSWESLTPQRQLAVTTTGFPFIGSDWQPHVTVASITPADWPPVWEVLHREPIVGPHRCDAMALYRLNGLTPEELLRVPA